jgi:4'-phosphopantetheinyl transferase
MQRDNWTRAPDTLDLKTNQVDIWRVSLSLQADSVQLIESTLSADEKERAARFHFPKDRDHFIIAHECLRDILARYLNCQPGGLSFTFNQSGKPALDDYKLEFNLSHSGDFALVAVTSESKVGVDIERIRSDMELESIASRYFSRSEFSELLALNSEQRVTGFFNCWTRKEAYIKAHGLGLSLPLESFDVSLTPNESVSLRATRPDSNEAACWKLLSFNVDSGYASAVAVDGQSMEFRLWDWNCPTASSSVLVHTEARTGFC